MPVGVDDLERDYDTLGGDAGTDKKSALHTGDDGCQEQEGARSADYAEEQISDDASRQGCHGGECSRGKARVLTRRCRNQKGADSVEDARGARTIENILNAKWGGPPGPRPTPTSAC